MCRIAAHAELEDRECDADNCGGAVLKDFRLRPCGPEALRSERPALGISAQKDEDGDADHQQWPVFGPGSFAGARQERHETHGEDDHTHPVMVVLGPAHVGDFANRQRHPFAGVADRFARRIVLRDDLARNPGREIGRFGLFKPGHSGLKR